MPALCPSTFGHSVSENFDIVVRAKTRVIHYGDATDLIGANASVLGSHMVSVAGSARPALVSCGFLKTVAKASDCANGRIDGKNAKGSSLMTKINFLPILLSALAVSSAQAEEERPIPDIRIAHEFVDCWTAIQYLKLTVAASAGEDSTVTRSYMARNGDKFEKSLVGAIHFYWKHLVDSGAGRDDFEVNRQRLMEWFDYDADNRALPRVKESMAKAMVNLKAAVEGGRVDKDETQGGITYLEDELNDEYCSVVFDRRINGKSMGDFLQPYVVNSRQRQENLALPEDQKQ